ncbi:sugar ABC transporter substrate-binding protein [Actinacidiphila bryophytorum]|uniref:sugar ABC transporter substrate-binding protein n=1 Tax=Actinacidiphila bryophytorum TaxID=1436133 RepID=UPI002176DC7F|nr:substrate-binding domain-containing protein [Actinacidiphila bryophytorum]UWE09616.1 substrate-binding domain-containing protein [Actinacidiphila bryophytorum]
MNAIARRLVVGSAVITLALTMAACGKAGDDKSSDSKDKTIGLLLPDTVTARYERADRPLITNKIKELCPDCSVEYANAAGDAAKQAQQVSSMVAKGVKVLILDAQDAVGIKSSVQAAVDKGIKVVAYDRLAQGPVSAYVSYDNEKVGELQGQALLDAMGPAATPQSKIVMINGDDADPNAAEFKAGAHKILDGKVSVAYEASGLWKDTVANQKVQAAITSVGKANIKGVYSANDTMAGGIATALKANNISVPLTGQDADLAAIQRILLGTQTSTVYKAPKPEAENTAQIAVDLLQGKDIKSVADATKKSGSGNDVPSKLLEAVSVTKANIMDTVVADGTYTVAQICTADFASACAAAGVK